MTSKTIVIDPGDHVECDMCGKDFTDSEEPGGLYGFETKAIGPCCETRIVELATKYDEMDHIKARCPEGMAFADWVRDELR